MINKVTLVGYLGADPEMRTLSSGVAVAKLRLATTEKYKDRDGQWREDTQWHDVVLWRHLADRAQRSLRKGSLVYLDGKLTHRKWQDKDGNPRKITEVVGSFFRPLEARPVAGASGADGREEPAPGPLVANDQEDLPF